MSIVYEVKTTEAIYESMKQFLIGKGSPISNFNVGSRLRTLLEAIAIINHKTQYDFFTAIKRAIPLAVFNGFEFEKTQGIVASGTLEFERVTPAGSDYPIPIGTAMTIDDITYETTIVGNILTGNTTSGQLTAQCSIVGTIGNININSIDTAASKGNFVNQPVGIETAKNPTAFTSGQDEESDEDRLKRFRDFINSLARSIPLGLVTGAKTVNGVISASLLENFPVAGTVTVFIDDGSVSLDPAIKTEVEEVLNGDPLDRINYPGYRAAGITIIVTQPTIINIDIDIAVVLLQSSLADDGEMVTLAKNAIEKYINTLSLGYDVIKSEIVSAIQNSNTEVYDVIMTTPLANININSQEKARINVSSYNVVVSRITSV